jgi:hypothetical protein
MIIKIEIIFKKNRRRKYIKISVQFVFALF